MNVGEKKRMSIIARQKGGHSRFDFVHSNSRTIYRCPIPEGGLAGPRCNALVNSNSLARKLKSHFDNEHALFPRDLKIQVVRGPNRSLSLFFPRPTKPPQRRRGRNTEGALEQTTPDDSQEIHGDIASDDQPREAVTTAMDLERPPRHSAEHEAEPETSEANAEHDECGDQGLSGSNPPTNAVPLAAQSPSEKGSETSFPSGPSTGGPQSSPQPHDDVSPPWAQPTKAWKNERS